MTTTKVARALSRTSPRHLPRQEPTRSRQEFEKKPATDLWRELQSLPEGSPRRRDIRNFFMEKFLPLVRYNAERIHTRLPDEVDLEDLMSAGVFGLMDAIDAFDLNRKVKFETYCAPRIRGAILDELRNMDWVPRLVRQRTAKVEAAKQQIEKSTGRPATEEDVAREDAELELGVLVVAGLGREGEGLLAEVAAVEGDLDRSPAALDQELHARHALAPRQPASAGRATAWSTFCAL